MKTGRVWAVALLSVLLLSAKREFSQIAPAASNPVLTVSPAKIDFSPQPVGQAGPPQVVVLTNTGSSNLRVDDILAAGIDFSENSTCKNSLPAAGSCNVEVTFRPATAGQRLGTLRISSSDGPRTVPLSGVGQ